MSNKTSSKTQPVHTGRTVAPEALGHGNSPAAWTCVFIMLLGALVSSVAFILGAAFTVLFIVGVVVMVIGLIVGYVMRAAGYGVGGAKLKNSGH